MSIPDVFLKGLRELGTLRLFGGFIRERFGRAILSALADLAAEAKVPGAIGKRLAKHVTVESSDLNPLVRTPGGLLEALAEATRQSPEPLDLVVTGHSKGGALAPAFALWLADARRAAGGTGWDHTGRTTIRYHAFAGPTPGNGAFAQRVVDTVGKGSCRVVNQSDLVPAAWSANGLRGIPETYPAAASLAPLIECVMADLQRVDLQYIHCAEPTLTFRGAPHKGRELGDEIVHQHMDAYLAEAGLLDDCDALTLFLG